MHVIVGLGTTGYSCTEFLTKKGIKVAVTDTRIQPPKVDEFIREFPDVPLTLGKLDEPLLAKAEKIIISPGMSLNEPAIARQRERGIPIIGDIELFAQYIKTPVIGITGTNAKSTVTTLVGEMARASGIETAVGGNLGTPVLELLKNKRAELFVLELSSFQLETTYSLAPHVATVLNISPDHMDRYATLQDYINAKKRIYQSCDIAVCNRDDSATDCGDAYSQCKLSFTLGEPRDNEFGLRQFNNENYLAYEDQPLIPVRELPILGRHYQANALAALAIGYGYGLPFEPMLKVLREFKGLAHRCQLVRERNGIYWYNDSKGTNIGATIAAIEGLGPEIKGKLILIAGGLGKNADFNMLLPSMQKHVKKAVLIGKAAQDIAKALDNKVPAVFAGSMEEAINLAAQSANTGDSVLLSPACASFDMFNNFEHRGEVFESLVKGLA